MLQAIQPFWLRGDYGGYTEAVAINVHHLQQVRPYSDLKTTAHQVGAYD